jgi:NAD(P)-dependent dehydrogenase (short-subunit alcohol dehydrogenase family)
MRPDAPIDGRFRNVLIQGASRGLGLELVRQLTALPNPPARVFATCRDPAAAADLRALEQQQASSSSCALTVLPLDVTKPETIQSAAARVRASLPQGERLDLVFNASGVLHERGAGIVPETSVGRVTADALTRLFAINATGPLLVAQAFLPLMVMTIAPPRDGAGRAEAAAEPRPAVLAALSARVGSIADNGLGGWYSYRASKAALNQLYRTLSIEVGRRHSPGRQEGGGGVACVLLHPGTCDTALTKPFQANVPAEKLFTVERGARQLLGLVASAEAPRDNGAFVDWAGDRVPW